MWSVIRMRKLYILVWLHPQRNIVKWKKKKYKTVFMVCYHVNEKGKIHMSFLLNMHKANISSKDIQEKLQSPRL